MKYLFYATVILTTSFNKSATAQYYYKAQQYNITPSQILIENYTSVGLSSDDTKALHFNEFDITNPYTFIQAITDNAGQMYHIIYQTDFVGKLFFLGYSNNLSSIFNNPEKPVMRLLYFLKNIKENLNTSESSTIAINCMIERLNYCSE